MAGLGLYDFKRQEVHTAAEQGDVNAQLLLGLGYYPHIGPGSTQNPVEAVKWLGKAAEHGNVTAQFFLGRLYYYGEPRILPVMSVPQDRDKAAKWLSKAGEQGDANAQFYMYIFEPDKTKVKKWLNKAVAQGEPRAKYVVHHHVSDPNDPDWLAVARPAMEREIEKGKYLLEKGTDEFFAQMKAREEKERREQEAKEAAEREREERERREREEKEAVERLSKAAEQGDSNARYELGLLYINGKGVPQDSAKARELFIKAAEQGHGEAKGYFAKELDETLAKFDTAKAKMPTMQTSYEYNDLAKNFVSIGQAFKSLPGLFDVQAQIEECETCSKQCEEKKNQCKKDETLSSFNTAKAQIPTIQTSKGYDDLAKNFAGIGFDLKSLPGSFDVQAQIEECETLRKQCVEKENQLKAEEEQRRQEEEARKAKEAAKKKAREKRKKLITIFAIIAAIGIPVCIIAYNSQQNSVTIPSGITVIKEGEFARKQLVNVEIPDGVTSIGNNAFKRNKLTGVAIPNSVTAIGEGAFANNRLISIAIGSNVTIEGEAFGDGFEAAYSNNGTGAGTYRRPDKTSQDWSVWHGNFEYQNHSGNITIINYDGTGGEVVIPAKINENPVTVIGGFSEKNLTSVTIPNGITTIGESAFSGNQLTSVTIPNSVTSIGINAFANNSITSFRLGANVSLNEEPGTSGAGVLGVKTGFNTAYANSGNRAGTYTRPNTDSQTWTRR